MSNTAPNIETRPFRLAEAGSNRRGKIYSIPGNFSAIATGVPINGTTPNLSSNNILDLVGYLDFRVDPASINVETVPEPGSGLLMGFAGVRGSCGAKWLLRSYASPEVAGFAGGMRLHA